MSARLAAVALTLLVACVGGQVPRSQLRGWHVAEVGRTRIVAQATADETRRLASEIASFDAAFTRLLGREITGGLPVTIALVRDARFGSRFGLGRGIGGWASTTLDGSFGFVLIRRSSVETRFTLFHEYTHLLVARNRRTPLPRWYNEGLATYFSTLAKRDGALVVGSSFASQLRWLSARGATPLERLIAEAIPDDYQEVNDYYATAWALTHYLLASPSGRSAISTLAEARAHGVSPDEAWNLAFDRPIEDVEQEIDAHIGHLARGVPGEIVLDPGDIVVSVPSTPRALEEEEVARELGVLLTLNAAATEDWLGSSVARALLRVGTGGPGADARAFAALADVLGRADDFGGADDALREALRIAPDDPFVLVRAARVGIAADDAEGALATLERALAIDAGSASTWFELGRAFDQLERPDEAIAALERARTLGWSAALDLEIGRLYLAAGRRSEARDRLWPIAEDPHGGDAAERARELLDEAGLDSEP